MEHLADPDLDLLMRELDAVESRPAFAGACDEGRNLMYCRKGWASRRAEEGCQLLI